MAGLIRNIVVIGGSYVGRGTAQRLARDVPTTHRVLLIEPHSHFHHIFTFPRFAVISGQEHKAFIPYSGTFLQAKQADTHAIVPARVLSVRPHSLKLDRQWQGSDEIEFDYLVVATGSNLTQPTALHYDDKPPAVSYLRKHQDRVIKANSVLVVGGGAAGVQMAADLKQYYPDKEIILAHSRQQLMPKFHPKFDQLIRKRFEELGITIIAGSRVVVPEGGFSLERNDPYEIAFKDGRSTRADFVVLATGQQPNNDLLQELNNSGRSRVLNPENGHIRVRPTMQFSDPEYDHLFAVGDIADTGAHKAARPGMAQADVVAANIQAMLQNQAPAQKYSPSRAAIHLTLGLQYNVIFRNPDVSNGQTEPEIVEKHDGQEDMNVESMWQRFDVAIQSPSDYHL